MNDESIVDAYLNKQEMFRIIREKSVKCSDKYKEIESMIAECKGIFELIFKNFYPERRQLGIFLLNQCYSGDKKDKKWMMSEKEIKENKRWNYAEVCLNTMGVSLLSIGGVKSNSIMEGRRDSWLYNMIALKDKMVMDKLKDILKEEKLELLNKMLDNIEILDYTPEYIKEQKLTYFEMDTQDSKFKKTNKSSKYIKLDLSDGGTRCFLLNKKESIYEDNDFALEDLDLDSSIIVEQVNDEICSCLEEYYIYLEKKTNDIKEHLNQLRGKFTKELIVMSLMQKENKNVN